MTIILSISLSDLKRVKLSVYMNGCVAHFIKPVLRHEVSNQQRDTVITISQRAAKPCTKPAVIYTRCHFRESRESDRDTYDVLFQGESLLLRISQATFTSVQTAGYVLHERVTHITTVTSERTVTEWIM